MLVLKLNGSHLVGNTGHALMASAGFLLKKLAYEHNLSVLVRSKLVANETLV